MELRIEYLPLNSLKPAERNAKKHDVGGIVGSAAHFGYWDPIVLDETTQQIVSGHGRREALLDMWQRGEPAPKYVKVSTDGEWEVPVVRGGSTGSRVEYEALALALNQLPENGGWDADIRALILEDIVCERPDLLDAMGVSDDTMERVLRETDPESLPSFEPQLDAIAVGREFLGREFLGRESASRDVQCPACGHRFPSKT